ncbi:MAG: UPF0158 family protein [Bacteroidota bacterium]
MVIAIKVNLFKNWLPTMPIPVKVSDIIGELEMLNDQTNAFLNKETGETVLIWDDFASYLEEDNPDLDLAAEMMGVEDADMEPYYHAYNDHEPWIALPTSWDIHDYSIMQDFCWSIDDEEQQDQLLSAIRGRGAFRMFRDTVDRLGLLQDWYDFKNDAYRNIAINWLVANDISYIDDRKDHSN